MCSLSAGHMKMEPPGRPYIKGLRGPKGKELKAKPSGAGLFYKS